MAVKEAIGEITELRELDGDELYGILGYFCKGHVDKQEFAIAVNQEYDLAAIGKVAQVSECHHIYARKVPIPESSSWRFVQCSEPGNGAFPCTYVEV